jgi:hypothetical protein
MSPNLHYRFVSFLFLIFATIAARADHLEPNSFIREKGTYVFDEKGSSIDVITAKDGKPSLVIDFHSRGKFSTSSNKMEFKEEGILRADGWFVFVESPNRLWIFDGKKSLAVVEENNSHTLVKECDGKAAVVCPAKVKEALPNDVREKILKKAEKHKAEK